MDGDSFPRLDSIRFDLKGYNIHDKQVITKTIIKRQKAKKWAIGVQGGYGYGFKSKQFEPYIGIGVSYTF
jgi:outer membrane protein W